MPRKSCYWTRKLELQLINFIKVREFIWKPSGNTNHDIQLKYKAYAEFAAMIDRGFTARSVRDRWVNIRSTFNHYVRKVEKSRSDPKADVYVPCWPLWKPLKFLCESSKRENGATNSDIPLEDKSPNAKQEFKSEVQSDLEEIESLDFRLQNQRTDRPRRHNLNVTKKHKRNNKCKKILDDLIIAMKPLAEAANSQESETQCYWFFGRHVIERLNLMSPHDAECASCEIMDILSSNIT